MGSGVSYWGHHIYNVPGASWIRNVSYVISMTEWIFLIKMIQDFKNTLENRKKFKYLITYKFIIAAEFWVFMNLLLALAMSVPAINRYTHGTHITVAHAMGTTIGINTMILFASFSYILGIDTKNDSTKKTISVNYWITQYSLLIFWLSLIIAGIIKGYRTTTMNINNFQEMMEPVIPALKVFSVAGVVQVFSIGIIASIYIHSALYFKKD